MESSPPLEPLNVSGETNEFVDSDMSDNDDLIANPENPTRPKWVTNTIHVVGEIAGNPSDPRRTISQFESALCMKDPLFVEKCYLMVEFVGEIYHHTHSFSQIDLVKPLS